MSEAAVPPGAPVSRPIGSVRGIGLAIVLFIVTLGLYGLYWYPVNFSDVKRYRGQGVGGLGGFLLLFVVVSPFLLPAYVGRMYKEDGQENPVSGWTGLWNLLPYVGVFVYLAKVQGALNRFWESKGAE
jgi:Domain of unknown function (DUF4234)